MKSTLITAPILLLLLFVVVVCAVSAQNTELLSRGNTFTYERYHIWESNDPNATPLPDVDFFARNNSVVTVKIDNVSSTEVDVHITVQYQNGTQRTEFIRHDILSGYNEPTSMVFGDSRIPHNLDLIQNPQNRVDYAETRTYGETMREVNVFSYIEDGWTMFDNTVYNVTATKKRCYDAQTGMFLESESELFTYNRNNTNLNQTIHEFFVLKDTNVWVVPKFPSDQVPSDLFLPFLITATATVAVVAVLAAVVYLKKRKRVSDRQGDRQTLGTRAYRSAVVVVFVHAHEREKD
jgi:hypothetical protein